MPALEPGSYSLPAGPVGVLLIHGYTGAPPEVRPVAEALHAAGCTVHAPLLPGHGTTWRDMNRCRWMDWVAHVEQAHAELASRCETVFAGGLSMGSLLVLHLAAQRDDLAGVLAYSPAIALASRIAFLAPVARWFLSRVPKAAPDYADPATEQRLWCYDVDPVPAAAEMLRLRRRVLDSLDQVRCPLLVVHGTLDRHIHPQAAAMLYERVGSTDKELLTLHNSGHCLTVDAERTVVAQRSVDFVMQHSTPPGA